MLKKQLIPREMVYKLAYNHAKQGVVDLKKNNSCFQWIEPMIMIVFDNGDVNAAAYYLAKAAQEPFSPNQFACALVQESIYDMFVNKVRSQFKPLDAEYAQHPNFINALDVIKCLNAKTIVAKDDVAPAHQSPTLVCDFSQNYFGSGPSGIITLNTFRTAKEALSLCHKEPIQYRTACIWNESLACAYELALTLPWPKYWFNCIHLSFEPIQEDIDAGTNFVVIKDKYHYETFAMGVQKSVIFPIGTIFAN